MEITICRFKGKDSPEERKHYKITNYKSVTNTSSLLLISDGKMHNDDGTTNDYFEIRKVQFIASCKTDFSDQPLLIAFYIAEGNELSPFILSMLGGDYVQEVNPMMVVDYKGYVEICEYTGETKLPLAEYIQEIRSGSLGYNTLLDQDGILLNYDRQKALFKEQDQSMN